MKWSDGKNSTTLFQFLSRLKFNSSITITGHSLGGTLASTLALVYARDLAGFSGNPVVCDAFAGATAGNSDFADYLSQAANLKLRRIWNNKDVVPHMWDVDDIAKLPTLYPPSISLPPDFSTDVQTLISALNAENLDYRQPSPDLSLNGEVNDGPEYDTFYSQAAYQHLTEYIYLANLQPADICTQTTPRLVE